LSRLNIHIRNISANWIGFGANIVVSFFLTPYIVHQLGNTQYGVWTILVSLTGYFGVLDVGVRGGLGRFVNYYLGKGKIHSVNEVFSTAIYFFCIIGLVIISLSALLATLLPDIFPKIPHDFVTESRIAILFIATTVWLNILCVSFRVVLHAFERFDLVNSVELFALGIRTIGTIWVLRSGYDIVGLACLQFCITLIQLVISSVLAKKVFPPLIASKDIASYKTFKVLFNFSIWIFISQTIWQLMSIADIIMIASVLGPTQVTYYSISVMVIEYNIRIASLAASVVHPEIIRCCAKQDYASLRWLVRRILNLSMLFLCGVIPGMVIFVHDFVNLWMGKDFKISANLILILSISMLCTRLSAICNTIASGFNQVKWNAIFATLSFVSNVGMSLFFLLVMDWGLYGVAFGTVVGTILGGAFRVWFVTYLISMPLISYFRDAWRWATLSGVYLCVCWFNSNIEYFSGWFRFAFQVAVSGILYLPLAYLILLPNDIRKRFANRLHSILMVSI